jgi:solute carrier family 25 (mitochondrial phosphate transporter), member 3
MDTDFGILPQRHELTGKMLPTRSRKVGFQLLWFLLFPYLTLPFHLGPFKRRHSAFLTPVDDARNQQQCFLTLQPNIPDTETTFPLFNVGSLKILFSLMVLPIPVLPAFSFELGSDFSILYSITFSGADPRFFLAGGICAAFSHGITTPIDVVKTRQQAEPTKYSGGVVDAMRIIFQEEGTSALFKGLGPTIVGYGIEGAAKFGLYENLKPSMLRVLHLYNPAIPYLIASVIAGAAASIVLCPLERTRIRLVTDPDFATNLLTGIPLLVKESGVRSLFSGFPAMLSKQVPYTLGKQVSFDEVAKYLYNAVETPFNAFTELQVSFTSALSASIVACVLSQPGDVILTATYKERGATPVDFCSVTEAVYDRQGIRGFYSGLTARFIQVGAIITSQLLLYDYVKLGLGLPATGSF